MAYGKYLLIFFLLICVETKAQENLYQQADSLSYALYSAGNWPQLITSGKQYIQAGNDFPALRLRLGYAFFISQKYTDALQQYDAVLANDSYNQTARYFAYWCNRYLNRFTEADYHASFTDPKTLNDEHINAFGITVVGLENSLKFPEDFTRNNASYTRLFAGNRFGWRLQAEHSVAYYNQENQDLFHQQNPNEKYDPDQYEFYEKLSYSVTNKLSLLAAYHLLRTDKTNHVGLFGLKYSVNKLEVQADVSYAYINQTNIFQYNAKLNWYPLGNLNFYTVTRGAFLQQDHNQFIISQLIGGKILKNVWTETAATFGRQNNYLEYDALYVYDFVDATTFKSTETVYFQLNPHLLLPLTYMFERKNNMYQNLYYNQHSITAAILWRF
ncbi:MAG: hypothetical protein ACRYFB_02760 [Janthinobacterium lividum]